MHDEFGQESVSARCLLTFAMRVLQLIGFPMKFLHNSGSIGLWRNTEIRSPSPTQKSRCTLVAPLRMWPRQKNGRFEENMVKATDERATQIAARVIESPSI